MLHLYQQCKHAIMFIINTTLSIKCVFNYIEQRLCTHVVICKGHNSDSDSFPDQKLAKQNCSSRDYPQEGAHWLNVMCCSLWHHLTFSFWYRSLKASGFGVNKEALVVNNCSWENLLAGLLCCFGDIVVSVSWASAVTAAGMLQALTGKSHWVISKLHLFVHRFSLALWPPSHDFCVIGLPKLTVRQTRMGLTPGREGRTHAQAFKSTVCTWIMFFYQ